MDQHRRNNQYCMAPSLLLEARGKRIRLQWDDPVSGRPRQEWAGPDELLGLKIVTEQLNLRRLAHESRLPLSRFYRILSYLDRKGILQAPPTLLRRQPEIFGSDLRDDLFTVTNFGLQWHITQACDLHCRHCYDRTPRSQMTEAQALRALDELERFCHEHWVVGNICFTGGNPFLYRGFFELYHEAVRRGFGVQIMGNPVGSDQLEKLCRIQPPEQFQVSLEGRRTHNDSIRGAGTYDRVLSFLEVLKEMKVDSGVMLTLTADNLAEVLPLARLLEKRTEAFNFSRLSQVGEGATLAQPTPQRFRSFLKRYIAYAEQSRIAGYKENLINLMLYESGQELFHGCTGFGCAVAFDGVVLLSDGEVHGCRKFPSLMGNLWEQSLEEIYFSDAGETFRRGMRACDGCSIRPVCGGCVAASPRPASGISDAVDPFCWRLWVA